MLLNRERATRIMKEKGIDILVATLAENVFYLSDLQDINHRLFSTNNVFAVLPQEGPAGAALVVPQGDVDTLVEFPTWIERIIPYGFFFIAPPDGAPATPDDAFVKELAVDTPAEGSPVDALRKALAPLEPDGKTVGVDERGLTRELWETVVQALPRCRVVPAYATLREIRMAKTPEEIVRLRRAHDIAELGLRSTIRLIKEGVSEKDLADEFEHVLIRNGARHTFTLISFGEKGGRPNLLPSPHKKLATGDLIRWDVGCVFEGYYSDIGRTYVFGEPSAKQVTYHQACRVSMEEAIAHVRPGAVPDEIFHKAVAVAQKSGIPHFKRSHVGHGIGAELYDPPVFRPGVKIPLEENMIIDIETPYYEIGFGAIIVEDTMRITRTGVEIFTESDRGLVRF